MDRREFTLGLGGALFDNRADVEKSSFHSIKYERLVTLVANYSVLETAHPGAARKVWVKLLQILRRREYAAHLSVLEALEGMPFAHLSAASTMTLDVMACHLGPFGQDDLVLIALSSTRPAAIGATKLKELPAADVRTYFLAHLENAAARANSELYPGLAYLRE